MTDATQTNVPAAESTNQQAGIQPKHDATVDMKEFKFRFKKDKLGSQRPTVEIIAAVPSVEGIVAILEKGGKGLELLQDAMYDVVRGAIGSVIAEDESASQATIDWSKLDWDAIANQPRADRRASAITDESWEAFSADYLEVMPGVTGKKPEQLANAVLIYRKKFSVVKTDKPVLNKLKDQLALYVETTRKGEDFQDIIEVLQGRLDTYLKADDIAMLVANL